MHDAVNSILIANISFFDKKKIADLSIEDEIIICKETGNLSVKLESRPYAGANKLARKMRICILCRKFTSAFRPLGNTI